EGAPGQGKTTVTQFLCQVHRMRLLDHTSELELLAEKLRAKDARIPFRIDLRDYASWLSGKDPFSASTEEPLPPGTSIVLERFISAQVAAATGTDFDTDDFLDVVSESNVLVVLDGFDEVADIRLRN